MTTDEEKNALNRRVAECLGWRWWGGVSDTGMEVFFFTDPARLGDLWKLPTANGAKPLIPIDAPPLTKSGMWWQDTPPSYCNNPAAADLVRLEIERKGWGWELKYDPETGNYRAYIWIPYSKSGDFEGYSKTSPYEALCIAFVAACEAEAAVKATEDEEK